MPKDNSIVLIKKESVAPSKQVDAWEKVGTIHPPSDPSALIFAYQSSFVIGGIVDKVSTTASSEWTFTDDVSEYTRNLFQDINLDEMFLSLWVTGNFYLEKRKNWLGKTILLDRFMSEQVRIRKVDNDTIEYVQIASWSPTTFTREDVVHIKMPSLTSRYYGESKLAKCMRQVILLWLIDKYYSRLFDGGFMGSKILIDKSKTLTKEQKDAIRIALDDLARGVDNAFNLMILPGEFEKFDLDDISTLADFLKYREDLIQSIAIALNVPVDILLPQKSSRATKSASLSEFNTDIIYPLQQRVMRQLRSQLRDEFPDIDGVNILAIDTRNQLDEMKVWTGYQDAWTISVNEARDKIGFGPVDGGDVREKRWNTNTIRPTQDQQDELDTIEKTIQKMYESL